MDCYWKMEIGEIKMTHIGQRWYKPEIYKPEDAKWVNNNNATIKDMGDYYESIVAESAIYEPTYAQKRAAEYPEIVEQLDCLYHDIDGGLLGEQAKETSFYLARKVVKEKFPKPIENE